MRWIVISLILINALIFGWRWWASTTESPQRAASVQSVAAEDAIELLPDSIVEPTMESPSAGSDAAGAKTESVTLMTDPDAISAPLDEQSIIANSAESVNPVTALTEAPATPVPGPSLSPSCAWTAWGTTTETIEPPIELLKTETQEQEIGRSYLVYIPAKASREQTLDRLAEVKVLGLEAAYLNKGPQTGGISLGLFSKPESMATKLAELKTAGINDARGLERIRTETQQRQLLRWIGEKTPNPVTNQALVSCNDIAQVSSGQ